MSFCDLIKGISPHICILCVTVKINMRLNFFVFGSIFADSLLHGGGGGGGIKYGERFGSFFHIFKNKIVL